MKYTNGWQLLGIAILAASGLNIVWGSNIVWGTSNQAMAEDGGVLIVGEP